MPTSTILGHFPETIGAVYVFTAGDPEVGIGGESATIFEINPEGGMSKDDM